MSTQKDLPLETATAKTKRPDILTMIAHKKLNLSAPWSCCGWNVIDPDGLLIRTAVERTITKGKRKGRAIWEGEVRETFATQAEIGAMELKWEQESAKCHQCGGDGQEWAGWHHI